MKYKVGDKVKVIDNGLIYSTYRDFIKANAPELMSKWTSNRDLPNNGVYEVKAIGKHRWGNELAIIEQNNKVYIIGYEGLKLVQPNQFTKSDLKDNHIVVQGENSKSLWLHLAHKCFNEDLTVKDFYNKELSINEVYEFDKLIWKREILDEVEKKYLSDVIRPFRDRVAYIKKREQHGKKWQDIVIDIKHGKGCLFFPEFEPNTMYKGMEIDKEYSLKDLGL